MEMEMKKMCGLYIWEIFLKLKLVEWVCGYYSENEWKTYYVHNIARRLCGVGILYARVREGEVCINHLILNWTEMSLSRGSHLVKQER